MVMKAPTCPACGSHAIRGGKCLDCGVGLTHDEVEFEELSDGEVLRQLLISVRSIRAMVLFFVVLIIIGLVAQLIILANAT